MQNKTMARLAAAAGALLVAGCAPFLPTPNNPDAMLDRVMKTSFTDRGIAKVDRLEQNDSQRRCVRRRSASRCRTMSPR